MALGGAPRKPADDARVLPDITVPRLNRNPATLQYGNALCSYFDVLRLRVRLQRRIVRWSPPPFRFAAYPRPDARAIIVLQRRPVPFRVVVIWMASQHPAREETDRSAPPPDWHRESCTQGATVQRNRTRLT